MFDDIVIVPCAKCGRELAIDGPPDGELLCADCEHRRLWLHVTEPLLAIRPTAEGIVPLPTNDCE